MVRVWLATGFVAVLLVLSGAEVPGQESRSGTVIGEVKGKKDTKDGKNTMIEVLAPGEEKARSYHVQYDPKLKGPVPEILKAVRAATVGDRVELEWVATGHGPAITKFHVIKKAGGDKKHEIRKGTVTGLVTAKAKGWIELKGDGEEKARRYWKFGNRHEVNKQIDAVAIGSRVRVEWEAPGNEGPHVARLEVLKAPNHSPEKGTEGKPPTLEEALAWIKRVDGELKKPRYADLTLDRLQTLTELQLGGHRKSDNKHLFIHPEEFRYLTPLTGLKKLHLGENDGVTDEALGHVGHLTGLTELVLWDAPITDAGLKHLAGLKELTALDLAFATRITTAGLEPIGKLSKLERLNLAGTKVSDVSSLARLHGLKELRLGKLKPAGVDALKQANPQLVIK